MKVVYGVAVLGALLCVGIARAAAQDGCVPETGEPDDLQLTPASGTPERVTLDSPVLARFPAGTDVSSADPTTLLQLREVTSDGEEVPVPGTYERIAAQPNVLIFRPEGDLPANTSFVGDAVDPAGREPRTLSFSTGDRVDRSDPEFLDDTLELRSRSNASDCGDVRVDVAFTPADDDGPRGSIEHLVFQTRGAGVAAPVLRQRVRAAMASKVSASFLLGDDEASEPVCVQVLAVDGSGRVGRPLPTQCFTPSTIPRFVGLCAASPARSSPRGFVLGLSVGLLCAALAFRRSNHGRY